MKTAQRARLRRRPPTTRPSDEFGWPPATQFFWSRIQDIEGVSRDDLAADFWSGKKDRSKEACRALADLLFAASRGAEAHGALMLAADPAEPQTFEIVLPQLAYAPSMLIASPASVRR